MFVFALVTTVCSHTDTYVAPTTVAAIDGAREAIQSETWSVLHSGTSDYLLAGPASRLTPEAVTQALVSIQCSLCEFQGGLRSVVC
jgi:hypothetical protein